MESLTTAWYTLAFLSLVSLFIVIACYEAHCATRNTIYDRRRRRNNNQIQIGADYNEKPVSPAPSYSKFAPPSYESVVARTEIFIISENCLNCSGSSTAITSPHRSLRNTVLIHQNVRANSKRRLNEIEWNSNKK